MSKPMYFYVAICPSVNTGYIVRLFGKDCFITFLVEDINDLTAECTRILTKRLYDKIKTIKPLDKLTNDKFIAVTDYMCYLIAENADSCISQDEYLEGAPFKIISFCYNKPITRAFVVLLGKNETRYKLYIPGGCEQPIALPDNFTPCSKNTMIYLNEEAMKLYSTTNSIKPISCNEIMESLSEIIRNYDTNNTGNVLTHISIYWLNISPDGDLNFDHYPFDFNKKK